MGNKRELSIKTSMELGKLVSYLKDLTTSLENRKVFLQRGNEYVALFPEDNVSVEIRAEQKKGKEKLTLEFGWRKQEKESKELDLVISSEEPEIPEEDVQDTEEASDEKTQ